ncbi:heavy-metal-associated domain-containing protein [Flavitalea antarctica]
MKNILLVIAIAFTLTSEAQVSKISLQASGLTCSMCSKSIDKALKTLDFIQNIEADIKTYTFEITIKEDGIADFNAIKKRVEGAGFSVSSFIATINFGKVTIEKHQPLTVGNTILFLVNPPEQPLNGTKRVKLLDKGFVSAKEYRQTNLPVLAPGTYHASI